MSGTMSEEEFRDWETRQPRAFILADGRPVCLPEEFQASSRLDRVRQLAMKVLADEIATAAWMGAPQVKLGGLEPATLASDGEEGCKLVLLELVRLGRLREASSD